MQVGVRVSTVLRRVRGLPLNRGCSLHALSELALLDKAWEDPRIHLLSVIGVGGAGKTALVNHWLECGVPDYRGARSVFLWSFSGQGESDQGAASDELIVKAWRWFCPGVDMPNHWIQRAEHLAEHIAADRNLLVLDGLEVFQNPPGKDGGHLPPNEPLLALLMGLARVNQGLCIVTSRIEMEDLRAKREKTAPQLALDPISGPAGAALLRRLGVTGSDEDLESAVSELWGHPLSLVLLGRYLTQSVMPAVAFSKPVL